MRKFKLISYWLLAISLFINGCEKKDYSKEPYIMHWDRDMCERCKMAISERKFAAQAVDEHNNVYKFDDIGCFILWQRQERPDIKIKKIWVTDAKTGKWIDAKTAIYVKGYITPMDYGFGAFTKQTAPKNKTYYDFLQVREEIIRIGK
jgi:copper chaperone NosL